LELVEALDEPWRLSTAPGSSRMKGRGPLLLLPLAEDASIWLSSPHAGSLAPSEECVPAAAPTNPEVGMRLSETGHDVDAGSSMGDKTGDEFRDGLLRVPSGFLWHRPNDVPEEEVNFLETRRPSRSAAMAGPRSRSHSACSACRGGRGNRKTL
jgi:hypothetical protein